MARVPRKRLRVACVVCVCTCLLEALARGRGRAGLTGVAGGRAREREGVDLAEVAAHARDHLLELALVGAGGERVLQLLGELGVAGLCDGTRAPSARRWVRARDVRWAKVRAGYGRSPLSSAMSSSTRSIGQPSSMHLSAASSRPIETAARSGAVAVRGAKGRRNASVPAAKRARARRRRAIIVSLRSDSHGHGRRERRAEAGVHCCSVGKLASRVSPSDDRA